MSEVKFMKCPTKIDRPLYKYFSNLQYAKDSIIDKTIHLEKINTYNDIFDGSIAWTMDNVGELSNKNNSATNLVLNLFEHTNKPDIIDKLKYNDFEQLCVSCDSMSEVIDVTLNIIKNIGYSMKKTSLKKEILKVFGGNGLVYPDNIKCSCFSEVNDSLLMWAYYANCHKGICLEYKFSSEDAKNSLEVQNLAKVHYTDSFNDGWNNCQRIFEKSIQWQHEQEWRMVCDIGEKEYLHFPYISNIYIGSRMDNKEILEFKDIAKQYSLKMYKAYPSTNKYELLFHELKL